MSSDSDSLGGALIAAGACVLLVFCMIVMCASYCHRLDDDVAIDSVDLRNLQLREDLVDTVLDAGRSEWQCLVCAHMNHPNHELCLLCGTSAEFSTMQETVEDPTTHVRTRRVARTTFLGPDNGTLLSSTLLEDLEDSGLGDTGSSGRSVAMLHKAKTLPMLRSGSSFGDNLQELEATTSMRQRALRYRRLNEMQLTQKQRGASRRRLWQRVPLPNGGFVWVRTMEPAAAGSVFARADSFVHKLKNNSFLAQNPQAKHLHGDLAEQLHRKNAASMGFFTELNAAGTAVAWRKTDSVALDVEPKGGEGDPLVDFEGVLAMTWREKKRWFLKQVTNLAVPYTEAMFKIDVRRDSILDDSVPQLAGDGLDTSRMQEHLNIGFIGEPALDAGGVLREWFGLVCKELFSAERGLFVTTHAEDSSYWINSESAKCVPEGQDHLQYFTFAGRLLGKAILDGLVLEVGLSLPLLKHLLGVPITFSDLEFLDEELFKHLSWVRDNDHVDALCVTFSIQTPSGETVELKPDGGNVDVTDENKMEYLSLVLRYRMLDSVSAQLTALLKGLYEVLPKSLLTIFDYQELDFYLSGLPMLNVTDWQNNSRVRHCAQDDDSEGIEQELELIQWFWDVVGSFTDDQRARLLQFATGCSRVPVEGFRALTSASGIVHPFTLQLVPTGTPPLGMCPRAHTCFNRIDLPVYETKEDLSSYLSLVIQMEITGFGFDVVVMTKRSKKRSGKKSSEAPHNASEAPETIAERPNQSVGGSGQGSVGPTVDLSFFRSSAQLYGELHQRLSRASAEGFTESGVSQIGRQVLEALDELTEAVDPRSDSRNSCPFVMLLSMLLPTLRKFLAWTQTSRSVWGSNFVALRHQSTSSDGALYRGEADTVLWAMVAQHNVLSRVSLQTAHILRLIESNESGDHDGAHPRRTTPHLKAPKPTSQASSASSSCSSVASTPRDPMEVGVSRTPRASRDQQQPVAQIHHISMELANVDAECKVHVADLTENLVEVVDMIAKHMCTPTASKDAGRSRISAREFVERLVQQLLEPMGQRMLAEPSVSHIDLFPRLLEQCITVTIDNFARSTGKRNELLAGPFEAAVMRLRTWTFKLEIEYNTLMRSLSNSSNNTDSSTDTDTSESLALSHAYVPTTRMDLMTLGGFKRLETTVSSWLNASSATGTLPDQGSGTSSRSWGVSSLAGGIRSTLVRTFSGRATFGGPPV